MVFRPAAQASIQYSVRAWERAEGEKDRYWVPVMDKQGLGGRWLLVDSVLAVTAVNKQLFWLSLSAVENNL
jgi:hypothetical protein